MIGMQRIFFFDSDVLKPFSFTSAATCYLVAKKKDMLFYKVLYFLSFVRAVHSYKVL
jgi:hypothetical protein